MAVPKRNTFAGVIGVTPRMGDTFTLALRLVTLLVSAAMRYSANPAVTAEVLANQCTLSTFLRLAEVYYP